MKSYHVLFVGLGIVGIIIFYVIWNIGLLKPIVIEQVQIPEQQIIFKKYQGAYQNAGPLFEQVEKLLAEKKIICSQTFGRYYDNPNEIEPERTRADIGCIFNEKIILPLSTELQTETVLSYTALAGKFEGAPWLTAFKVYKALKKESYQRNIMLDDAAPVFETYEKIENGFRTTVYFKIKSI